VARTRTNSALHPPFGAVEQREDLALQRLKAGSSDLAVLLALRIRSDSSGWTRDAAETLSRYALLSRPSFHRAFARLEAWGIAERGGAVGFGEAHPKYWARKRRARPYEEWPEGVRLASSPTAGDRIAGEAGSDPISEESAPERAASQRNSKPTSKEERSFLEIPNGLSRKASSRSPQASISNSTSTASVARARSSLKADTARWRRHDPVEMARKLFTSDMGRAVQLPNGGYRVFVSEYRSFEDCAEARWRIVCSIAGIDPESHETPDVGREP